MSSQEICKVIDDSINQIERRLRYLKSIKSALSETHSRTFTTYLLTSEQIISDLVPHIAETSNEILLYWIGINDTRTGARIPTRVLAPMTEDPSACFVKADALSSYKTLSYADLYGLPLLILIHSHPGVGRGATAPSGQDIRTMIAMEKHYPVIGCIFSQDLYFRFFSVSCKPAVEIFGKGVTKIEDNIYRIDKDFLQS